MHSKKNFSSRTVYVTSSYNKYSLLTFLRTLQKTFRFFDNVSCRVIGLKKKMYLVSVLKSPHVNKIAQEQFHRSLFSFAVTVHGENVDKTMIMITKSLKSRGFSDVSIKVVLRSKSFVGATKIKKLRLPDEYLTDKPNLSVLDYINLLDAYGECYIARLNFFKRLKCPKNEAFLAQ